MIDIVNKEKAIRAIVRQAIEAYASGFSDRHISELNNEEGTINMKIHNVFIAALGADIQYYSALSRSLDSSLGNMLEKMAINIASLNYEVTQHVEGPIYQEQTDYIAELLEAYKNTRGTNHKKPTVDDYAGISRKNSTAQHSKRHESDYYLKDVETGMHYLIELKIGGDLDNKKARSEKEALLEQYCILANRILLSYIMVILAISTYAQNDVTTFLGIPVDGFKSEMKRKLISKGFVPKKFGSKEFLEGEFNGADVNVHIVTNNNKVYRIMLCDTNTKNDVDIKNRFNTLVRQFENNERYSSFEKYTIPDEENISYEMPVHNKVYEAIFYQASNTKTMIV